MKKAIVFALACLAAAAIGFGTYRLAAAKRSLDEAPPPGLAFTDLDGAEHRLEQWHGKLLLINFWATWCTPCIEEIPELVKLQKQYGGRGLQIIGPAVDDADAARAAMSSLGIDYPVMTGSVEALTAAMEKLGNDKGALPFSVVVSPEGRIIERHLGQFSAAELQALVQPRLPGARPGDPPGNHPDHH